MSEECSDKMEPVIIGASGNPLLSHSVQLLHSMFTRSHNNLFRLFWSGGFELIDISTRVNRGMIELKERLQCYNYRVRHISGSKIYIADALSRKPT